MKKAILTCFLLILCTICFAEASGWFSPYPAGFNVNLEDSETYTGAAESIGLDGTGDAKRWNVSGYNDLTLIGLVGATGLGESSTVTVTIEMEVKRIGDTLCYYSASEPELKRPFYIDLVACNRANDGNRKVTRIGYNDKDQSFSGSVTLTPYNGEAWADIVLCLPDEGVDLSYALSADDYYCGLTINMTGAVTKTWSYTFNGYIQDAPLTNKAHVFFIVDPEPEASAMSLKELIIDRKKVQIGTYSFETQAFMSAGQTAGGDDSLKYEYQKENMYSIFASSSPDPFYGNETFSMKYEGDSSKSFPFEIIIESDRGKSETYYGSEKLPLENEESTGTATVFLLDSKAFDEALGDNHSGRSLYFRDNGSILLKVPDNYKKTEEDLYSEFPAGTYSSTVYFHVVSKY